MKRIFLLLMMAAVVLSCERNEMENPYTTATKETYKKYAPRENLTVALLGEYKGYNAVMLQAHTDEEWQFICKEFDIDPEKKKDIDDDSTKESIRELGIEPTEAQMQEMAEKCIAGLHGPAGKVKKLHAEDIVEIFKMAL